MKKLLIAPAPLPQESIFSYILRLTNANMYPTPYWIYDNLNLIKKGTKFLSPHSQSIDKLQKLTDIDKSRLGKLTYFSDLEIGKEKSEEYNLVYQYSIDGKYSKICPRCFNKTPYQRKVWDYKTVIACPYHKCLLINKCNSCGKKIPHYRKEILNCICGGSLLNLPIINAETDEIDFSIFIYEKLGFSNLPTLNNINNNKINHLKLYQIMFLSITLLNRIYYIKERNFLALNHYTEDNDFRGLLSNIYQFFNNWPDGYYAYLKKYQESKSDNNNKNQSGLINDFQHLYLILYKGLLNTDYNFLREGFENYIEKHWENGSIRNSKYLAVKKARFITTDTVLKDYGLTSKTLRKLFLDNKIKGKFIDKENVKTQLIVEESELIKFVTYMNQFITKNEAAKLLGVNHKNLNILIKEGFISEDVYLFTRLRKGSIKRADIESLHNCFKRYAKKIDKNYDLVHIDSVLISLSGRFLNIVDLIKMVTKELLTPYIWDEFTLDIRNYYFSMDQLNSVIELYLITYCDFTTPKQIMKQYEIHEFSILFFIKEGIMLSEIKEGKHYIKKEDFNEFNRKYVSAPELFNLIRMGNSKIHQYLNEQGVFPVLAKTPKGKGTYLYLRNEVEAIAKKGT